MCGRATKVVGEPNPAVLHGDQLRQRNERFENLPEDIRVSIAREDAGFMRHFSWSISMTTRDIELKNIRHLETMKDLRRKDGFGKKQKLVQYWKSK